jgi:hypothetical protein
VNYVFAAVWIAEASWWGRSPDGYAARSPLVRWTLRFFYFVVLLNAVVIFASPARRLAGAALVACLVWTWLQPSFRQRLGARSASV